MNKLIKTRKKDGKTVYYTDAKKDTLIEALAAYEATGFAPDGIKMLHDMAKRKPAGPTWHICPEVPDNERHVLCCVKNRLGVKSFAIAFFIGEGVNRWVCAYSDIIAWTELPEPYEGE